MVKKQKHQQAINGLRLGDSVRVKVGYADDDFDLDIGGWQGRITEIIDEGKTVVISWDSVTVRNFPKTYLADCAEQGFGWSEYYIGVDDVEPTSPRDKTEDVNEISGELENEYHWHMIGPEGEDIRQVLAGIDPEDERAQMERWGEHLEKVLTFPFEAKVTEFQDRGPLRGGDIIQVHGITHVDGHYGVTVNLGHGRKAYDFPLCDLTPTDEASSNYTPVCTYAVWFANR